MTTETTALGAAYLAGLATGFWKDLDELKEHWKAERHFKPQVSEEKVATLRAGWNDAISRTINN